MIPSVAGDLMDLMDLRVVEGVRTRLTRVLSRWGGSRVRLSYTRGEPGGSIVTRMGDEAR